MNGGYIYFPGNGGGYNDCLMKKKIRTLFAIIALVISITLLAWSYSPVQRQVEVQSLTPSEMNIHSDP